MREASRRKASPGFAFIAGLLAANTMARAEVSHSHSSGAAQNIREQNTLCANVAASIEATRLEQKRRTLEELERNISTRLEALETRKNELKTQIEKIDAFEQRVNESLVAFYTGMKPDAAAAHIAELEDDTAAALLLRLKTRISAKILNEMTAARGAALAKRIARQRPGGEGSQIQ